LSKIPLTMIYKDHKGEYVNLLEVPKRKKRKTKKSILKAEREIYELKKWIYNYGVSYTYKSNNKRKNVRSKKDNQESIKVKDYKELIELNKTNKLVIIGFIYNLGKTNKIKDFQNYCEFKYRINREGNEEVYKTVLHKSEVLEVLDYLNNRK